MLTTQSFHNQWLTASDGLSHREAILAGGRFGRCWFLKITNDVPRSESGAALPTAEAAIHALNGLPDGSNSNAGASWFSRCSRKPQTTSLCSRDDGWSRQSPALFPQKRSNAPNRCRMPGEIFMLGFASTRMSVAKRGAAPESRLDLHLRCLDLLHIEVYM